MFQTGQATWDEGLQLFLERGGSARRLTTRSPIAPCPTMKGAWAGYCVSSPKTPSTIADRRLRTLARAAQPTRPTQHVRSRPPVRPPPGSCAATRTTCRSLCSTCSTTISSGPRLVAATGVEPATPISPSLVELADRECPWPFRGVRDSGRRILVGDLPAKFGPLPGALARTVKQALVSPIAKPGQQQLAGFVVSGISPRRPFDDAYRGFLDLLAGQVATAVASARAYEEENGGRESLAGARPRQDCFFFQRQSRISHTAYSDARPARRPALAQPHRLEPGRGRPVGCREPQRAAALEAGEHAARLLPHRGRPREGELRAD